MRMIVNCSSAGRSREEPKRGRSKSGLAQETLHGHHVQPAAALVPDLAKGPDGFESQPVMQAQGSLRLRVDQADHRMHSEGGRPRKQGLDERTAETLPTPVCADVHGMLHREPIAPARSPFTEACKADNLLLLLGDQHRKARVPARLK